MGGRPGARRDKKDGVDVVEGSLRCASCREIYAIEDSIPNILPPLRSMADPTHVLTRQRSLGRYAEYEISKVILY